MEKYATKVVVLTGAGGGIGSEIALKFARANARIALCDIRSETLNETVARCEEAGSEVYSKVVDLGDEAQCKLFCGDVQQAFGTIDVLVNTVGIVDSPGDVEELSTAMWQKTLQINLTSAFLMAKYAVPHMKVRGGAILNIASISGLANQEQAMAYSVSKAGLLSLTRSEAIDLARYKIRANAISPGSVDTPLLHEAVREAGIRSGRSTEAQWRVWQEQYPTQRFTQPNEVAELALFLCSERAANITGANLTIDGGLTALLPER